MLYRVFGMGNTILPLKSKSACRKTFIRIYFSFAKPTHKWKSEIHISLWWLSIEFRHRQNRPTQPNEIGTCWMIRMKCINVSSLWHLWISITIRINLQFIIVHLRSFPIGLSIGLVHQLNINEIIHSKGARKSDWTKRTIKSCRLFVLIFVCTVFIRPSVHWTLNRWSFFVCSKLMIYIIL